MWQRNALAANPANPTYRRFLTNHPRNLMAAARGLGDSEGVAKATRELAKFRDSDPANVALDARLAEVIEGNPTSQNDGRMSAFAYASGARIQSPNRRSVRRTPMPTRGVRHGGPCSRCRTIAAGFWSGSSWKVKPRPTSHASSE